MCFENSVAGDRAVVFDHFPHVVLEETFQFFLLCLHEGEAISECHPSLIELILAGFDARHAVAWWACFFGCVCLFGGMLDVCLVAMADIVESFMSKQAVGRHDFEARLSCPGMFCGYVALLLPSVVLVEVG